MITDETRLLVYLQTKLAQVSANLDKRVTTLENERQRERRARKTRFVRMLALLTLAATIGELLVQIWFYL